MTYAAFVVAVLVTLSTRTARFGDASFGVTVSTPLPSAAAAAGNVPPLLLLPPIGVGIDRSFCAKTLAAWDARPRASRMHCPDVIGMGDSEPKRTMRDDPWTPRDWALQLSAYIRDEIGEPTVVVGQSNLCAVAIEMAALDAASKRNVAGLVLCGPPALEALSEDKPDAAIRKFWRVVSSPLGYALFRFARRRKFLESFSKKNLFADPAQVDGEYLDVCRAGARDARTRHAIFSFVCGTWRRDYRPALAALGVPALVITGKDVAGAKDKSTPSGAASTKVDQSSGIKLLRWFAQPFRRRSSAGEFQQVGRDLGLDPEAKVAEYTRIIPRARSVLLRGWNCLPYENPEDVAAALATFTQECAPARTGALLADSLAAKAAAERASKLEAERMARAEAYDDGADEVQSERLVEPQPEEEPQTEEDPQAEHEPQVSEELDEPSEEMTEEDIWQAALAVAAKVKEERAAAEAAAAKRATEKGAALQRPSPGGADQLVVARAARAVASRTARLEAKASARRAEANARIMAERATEAAAAKRSVALQTAAAAHTASARRARELQEPPPHGFSWLGLF